MWWLSLIVVLARRAVQEYIITSIKEVLRIHFNRAVELKVSPMLDVRLSLVAHDDSPGTDLPSVSPPLHSCSSSGSPLNDISAGKPFLMPDRVKFSPLEGCFGRVGTEGLSDQR